MGTMERILRLMAENKASDLYLSANAPALIKIQGDCIPLNNQTLTVEAPRTLLAEIVSPQQIEALDMGRRGLHNEASELLRTRLAGKIETDLDTSRRLFTLICALHWRG